MNSNENIYKLSDIANLRNGAGIKQIFFGNNKGIPIARVSDFTVNSIDLRSCIYLKSEYLNDWNSYLLEEEDILVATVGSWGTSLTSAVGKVVKVPKAVEGAIQNQNTCLVKAKENISNQKWIYYSLRHKDFKLHVNNTAAGSANQARLSVKNLGQYEMRLPCMRDQKEIADILGTLDEKIELNKKTNETLEGIAKGLFNSWFIDFEPVRAKLEGRSTGLSDEISNLFPDSFEDSELGQIPKGWKIDVLSNHLSITKGKSYKSVELQESQNALVTLKSFERGGGYREEGLKPYSGEYKKEQIILPGELIIALTDVTQAADVIGRPAIVQTNNLFENLIASLDVGIIRTKKIESITKEFSIQLLKTPKYVSHALSYTSGTTVLHLAKELFESFCIVIPDNRLLRFFTCFYNEILQKIDVNQTNSKNLAEVRDALLPKLISGELRIPDAEKMIEEVGI